MLDWILEKDTFLREIAAGHPCADHDHLRGTNRFRHLKHFSHAIPTPYSILHILPLVDANVVNNSPIAQAMMVLHDKHEVQNDAGVKLESCSFTMRCNQWS